MQTGLTKITADRKASPDNADQTIGVMVFKISQWNLLNHKTDTAIAKVIYDTSRS